MIYLKLLVKVYQLKNHWKNVTNLIFPKLHKNIIIGETVHVIEDIDSDKELKTAPVEKRTQKEKSNEKIKE